MRPSPPWIAVVIAASLSSSARAFDYFEHRYLGNTAYRNALEEIKDPGLSEALARATRESLGFGRTAEPPTEIAERLLQKLPLQFGDLSALAGDFTEDEKDLKVLVGAMLGKKGVRAPALVVDTRRQWFSACQWLYRSRRASSVGGSDWEGCFRQLAGEEDLKREAKSEFGSSGYEASREESAEHEMIPKYVSLASKNKTHFPRHSWKSYSDYHSKALRFASCYGGKLQCPGSEGETLSGDALLVEAIVNEGFAQHYLHDSFAAGHIGTRYGTCTLGLLCTPTKQRVKQTHDVLNEIGLEVKISTTPFYFRRPGRDVGTKLQTGWTAFGDDHLFIREADFHRAVIVVTATESIREVLEHALASGGPRASEPCRMCTTGIFPIPSDPELLSKESRAALAATDLGAEAYPAGDLVRFDKVFVFEQRSRDPRVPGIPAEGWKVGYGFARQSLGGDLRTGPLETGALFRIDYMRNTDPLWPNTYGFEYWGLPNFRSSYLFTFGYSWPREVSPFSWAIRGKFGWRIEDTFTRNNPEPQRIGGVELAFPSLEVVYEVYPPLALFLQLNPVTVFFRHQTREWELANHKEFTVAWGLRFDLSGI